MVLHKFLHRALALKGARFVHLTKLENPTFVAALRFTRGFQRFFSIARLDHKNPTNSWFHIRWNQQFSQCQLDQLGHNSGLLVASDSLAGFVMIRYGYDSMITSFKTPQPRLIRY